MFFTYEGFVFLVVEYPCADEEVFYVYDLPAYLVLALVVPVYLTDSVVIYVLMFESYKWALRWFTV